MLVGGVGRRCRKGGECEIYLGGENHLSHWTWQLIGWGEGLRKKQEERMTCVVSFLSLAFSSFHFCCKEGSMTAYRR